MSRKATAWGVERTTWLSGVVRVDEIRGEFGGGGWVGG